MKRALPFTLLALVGCATSPQQVSGLNPDELKARLERSSVSVRPVSAPIQLLERTKGQAVANFIVASVVSSAVGSGATPRSASEMQANMQISQDFGQQLNQALPTGVESESGSLVDVRLAKRLSERFKPTPEERQEAPIELVVSATQWELAYESFFTSDDYTLSYALGVSVIERSTEKQKSLKHIYCQGRAPEKMSLDAWKADDQAALIKVADRIADECVQKTLSSLGLA